MPVSTAHHREDRDAFAEHFVIRQLAAAIIVVVHRRQIVVDERVGVNALDGAGQWQGVFRRSAASFCAAKESAGRIRLPPAKSE